MANARIRIIAAGEVETDILAEEEVPSLRQLEDVYLGDLRRLVKDKRATFMGRAVDEASGAVYQIYQLPQDGDEAPSTVFIEDRPATKVISTLLDDEGNVRRIQVKN